MKKSSSSSYTIYHNPRCTKSRATLALLGEHGIEPKVIEYLNEPPSAEELKTLLKKLGLRAEQLVRKQENVYKEKFPGTPPTEAQLIAAMVEHPILIERPIVVTNERAVIGRPPENVLTLLK